MSLTDLELGYEDLPCGVLVTNEFFGIIYCNNRFASDVKFSPKELIGKNFDSLLTNGSKILFQQILIPSVLHQNKIDEMQLNLIGADNNKIPTVIFANRDLSRSTNIVWTCFSAVERNKLLDELSTSKNELEKANSQLKILVKTDPLTGSYNRREMMHKLSLIRRHADRRKYFFGILMLDLDHFKAVNDNHGHTEGDHVLKQFARLLMDNARFDDIVARYGGEEFVIILPDIDAEGLLSAAGRIHGNMKKMSTKAGRITVSIGGGIVAHDINVDNEELIKMADKALYDSKKSGRNKTTFFSLPPFDAQDVQYPVSVD